MHLDPEDPTRPAWKAAAAMTEPTTFHPRVPRARQRPDDAPTRLSLADLVAAEPPMPQPIGRTLDEQAALNAAHSRRMDRLAGKPGGGPAVKRRGPGGMFGWRPMSGPSLAEVAAARQRIAETEERRKVAHVRHMDILEMIRAYLGIIALVLLVLFVGAAALLALGIMSGYYTWSPVHH